MRILDRYIAREFARIYVLFSLAAPLLFILGDWTDNLGTFADKGLTVRQVGLGYLYMFPMFILWSLPIAALIGTVFTVSNMTRHSEMAAAKAGGLSFYRVVAVLPVIGVLLTGFGLLLGEVVPVAMARRAAVLGETQRHEMMRTDFVYRAEHGDVFSIRRLDVQAGRIYGLSIARPTATADDATATHIYARDALYESGNGWTLMDGYVREYADGDVHRFTRFDALSAPEIRETPAQLIPTAPEDAEKEMAYAELGRTIERLERAGARPLDLKVKRAQKIAIPAATLIIILFGAPLANTSARSGPAYGIGISLGITIFYLLLFKISGAAGATGQLPPLAAAWIPNLLFLGGAIVLLARVRT
jgi:lipopolysaccharide export system permease protein